MSFKIKAKSLKPVYYPTVVNESVDIDPLVDDFYRHMKLVTALENIVEGLEACVPLTTNYQGEDTPDLNAEVPLETRIMATTATTLVDGNPEDLIGPLALPLDSGGAVAIEAIQPITYQVAIEGVIGAIGGLIKLIWDIIKNIFKGIIQAFKDFFDTTKALIRDYDKLINKFKKDEKKYEVKIKKRGWIDRNGALQTTLKGKSEEITIDPALVFIKNEIHSIQKTTHFFLEAGKLFDSITEGNINTAELKDVYWTFVAFNVLRNEFIIKNFKIEVPSKDKKVEEVRVTNCIGNGKFLAFDTKSGKCTVRELDTKTFEALDDTHQKDEGIKGTDIYNYAMEGLRVLKAQEILFKNSIAFNHQQQSKLVDGFMTKAENKADIINKNDEAKKIMREMLPEMQRLFTNVQKSSVLYQKLCLAQHDVFIKAIQSAKEMDD